MKNILLMALILPILLLSACITERVTVTAPPITVTAPPITITVTPPPPTQPQEKYEVVALEYKITEKNEVWWKFSWQLTLKNNTPQSLSLIMLIEFLDADGFIVDDDLAEIELGGGELKTFRGYALTDTDIAPNVKKADVREY